MVSKVICATHEGVHDLNESCSAYMSAHLYSHPVEPSNEVNSPPSEPDPANELPEHIERIIRRLDEGAPLLPAHITASVWAATELLTEYPSRIAALESQLAAAKQESERLRNLPTPHDDYYGPCDGLGPNGVCSECHRVFEGFAAKAEENSCLRARLAEVEAERDEAITYAQKQNAEMEALSDVLVDAGFGDDVGLANCAKLAIAANARLEADNAALRQQVEVFNRAGSSLKTYDDVVAAVCKILHDIGNEKSPHITAEDEAADALACCGQEIRAKIVQGEVEISRLTAGREAIAEKVRAKAIEIADSAVAEYKASSDPISRYSQADAAERVGTLISRMDVAAIIGTAGEEGSNE